MLIIVSCSKEIPFNQSVERHGLVYEVNSEKPFSGTLISNFENTQVHFKLRYKNGALDGLQETYYSSGQIESRENYQTGISKLFYYGNSGPSEVNCYNRFGNSASMSKCVSTTPMDQFLIKQ